jgi:hypothetical protein
MPPLQPSAALTIIELVREEVKPFRQLMDDQSTARPHSESVTPSRHLRAC